MLWHGLVQFLKEEDFQAISVAGGAQARAMLKVICDRQQMDIKGEKKRCA